MTGGTLARRYAKALLELSEEQKQTDKIGRDLGDLAKSWGDSAEFREIFENPSFSSAGRRQVLDGIAKRMGLSPLVRNSIMLLSDRRRMRFLPEIVDAFQILAEQKAGRVRAEVVTAAAMPETYFMQLQKALEAATGKKVVIVKREDPSLIGGVVTRVGDQVFDGSLKAHLHELKDELLTD